MSWRLCAVLWAWLRPAAGGSLEAARQDVLERSEDPAAWETLGNLLRRRGAWEESERSFRRALQLRGPAMQVALSGLGTSLFEQNRFTEAEQYFRAAAMLAPDRSQVHENLAMALEQGGRLEEAIQSLRKALSLAPHNIQVRNFLGELLTEETRFREAEDAFRDSLAIDPKRADTNRQLGDALLMRQAYEEAVVYLARAVEADHGGEKTWQELGYTLEFMGRDAEAEALYRLILENSTRKADVLWQLSRLAKSRGDAKEAEELLREAIRHKSELENGTMNPRHLRDLGSVIFMQGREDEARETWRGLLQRLAADGLSLVHFNTNFRQDEEQYKAGLNNEAEAFAAHCETLEKVLRGRVTRMVRTVRQMENSEDWLLTWADETTRRFAGGRLISYGVTYFSAWREAVRDPLIQDAMASAVEPVVMLVGSALGYQCAFAISLGFAKCVGYDLLCSSMVAPAQKMAEEVGLSDRIQFHCADALTAPELKEAAVVWINDDCFPRDFSRTLRARLAEELPPKAAFVSYKAAELEEANWLMASTLTAEVSWNSKQFLHIYRRKTLEETEACVGEACEA